MGNDHDHSSSYSAVRKAEDENEYDGENDSSPQIRQIEKHQIRQKMGEHSTLQAAPQKNETKRYSRNECKQKPVDTVDQAKQ